MVRQALISKLRNVGVKVVECLPSSASSLNDSLSKRCRTANNNGVDVFVSIHHNSCPGGQGSECLCIKGGQQNALAERLGNEILEEIARLGFKNRGVKDRRNLYVINNTRMPAIIVECAFVDSERDMKNYDTEKMAMAIFKGICKFYEISCDDGSQDGSQGGTSTDGNSNSSSNDSIGWTSYTVQKGDTLWGISRKFGVSVDDIVRINGIKDKDMIYVGQNIRF